LECTPMAFEGSLQDLSLVDVLQLIQVARKSGALLLFGPGCDASLSMKDGQIVGCKHPSPGVNVGQELVKMGAVTAEDVAAAAQQQVAAGEARKPLVTLLVEQAKITKDKGFEALKRLIERTVLELLSWSQGTFVFETGEIPASDDFRHVPEAVASQVGLDTQGLLMDALRIIDERNHERQKIDAATSQASSDEPEQEELAAFDEPKPTEPEVQEVQPSPPNAAVEPSSSSPLVESPDELDDLLKERLLDDVAVRSLTERKVAALCRDGLLKLSLRSLAVQGVSEILVSEFEQDVCGHLARWREQGLHPMLLVDAAEDPEIKGWRRSSLSALARCRAQFPEVSVTVLDDSTHASFTEAFNAGATTVLPRPSRQDQRETYVERMRNLSETIRAALSAIFARRTASAVEVLRARKHLKDLKERVRELRHPDGASTISLVALKFVAEYVDRCVLFLVRKTDLLGLGAFGIDQNCETLGAALTKLKIPLDDNSCIARVVTEGRPYFDTCDDASLHSALYGAIGRPTQSEIVLLPLKTRDRTAALIYGDFMAGRPDSLGTEALEILADFAGMAFDLALKDRATSSGGVEPGAPRGP